MTNDEIKDNQEIVKIQQETLKNLEKFNEKRKTEIVNEPEEEEVVQPEEKLTISHICPYCGMLAYQGQIHGLGYCREKVQYQE
jgi:DNA gyrase/topoisomerase IV subunit A